MTSQPQETSSPSWSPTFKLLLGLTFIVLIAAFLVRFQNIIGPLILAFVLSYLLHPLIKTTHRLTKIPWRTTVSIIFLIVLGLVITLFVFAGLGIGQQAVNLFRFIQRFVNTELPALATELANETFAFGPLQIDFSQYDLTSLINQALGVIQPAVGQASSLVGSIASTTFSGLGWMFFIFIIAYFVLAETDRLPFDVLDRIEIPGHDADIRRLARNLNYIWNAFLRGQFILFIMSIIIASVLMTLLGVRYALAIGLLAGFSRFIPYVGALITWTIAGLVAFLMESNYLGLDPLIYTALVLGIAVLVDAAFDNLIAPRIYGQALGVHPAAVLIAAIVGASLLGFVGLILAAPVLATLLLFGRYAIRKMFDLPPWPNPEIDYEQSQAKLPGTDTVKKIAKRIKKRLPIRRN